MSEGERSRVVDRIAGSLSAVSHDDIIERSIGYFRKADGDLGARLAEAVYQRRAARSR